MAKVLAAKACGLASFGASALFHYMYTNGRTLGLAQLRSTAVGRWVVPPVVFAAVDDELPTHNGPHAWEKGNRQQAADDSRRRQGKKTWSFALEASRQP